MEYSNGQLKSKYKSYDLADVNAKQMYEWVRTGVVSFRAFQEWASLIVPEVDSGIDSGYSPPIETVKGG